MRKPPEWVVREMKKINPDYFLQWNGQKWDLMHRHKTRDGTVSNSEAVHIGDMDGMPIYRLRPTSYRLASIPNEFINDTLLRILRQREWDLKHTSEQRARAKIEEADLQLRKGEDFRNEIKSDTYNRIKFAKTPKIFLGGER